jgi:hypothetical protein
MSIDMNPFTSYKVDLTVAQSVFLPNKIMTHSITNLTYSGGVVNDLISTIEFLSKSLTALAAAFNSGSAASRAA